MNAHKYHKCYENALTVVGLCVGAGTMNQLKTECNKAVELPLPDTDDDNNSEAEDDEDDAVAADQRAVEMARSLEITRLTEENKVSRCQGCSCRVL